MIEGALASAAPFVAVIDADMQHDETLLPRMLNVLRGGDVDLVVGSRYLDAAGLANRLDVQPPLTQGGGESGGEGRLAGAVDPLDRDQPAAGHTGNLPPGPARSPGGS